MLDVYNDNLQACRFYRRY